MAGYTDHYGNFAQAQVGSLGGASHSAYLNQATACARPQGELDRIADRLQALHDSILGATNSIEGACSRTGLYSDTPPPAPGLGNASLSVEPTNALRVIERRIDQLFNTAELLSELSRRLEKLA